MAEIGNIRSALDGGDLNLASNVAQKILSKLPIRELTSKEQKWLKQYDDDNRVLWLLQIGLFQTSLKSRKMEGLAGLKRLYNRPLNVLGQVEANPKDVGGMPVIANTELGDIAICLERNHIAEPTEGDRESSCLQETHFNPGFVASEIPTTGSPYSEVEELFWCLVKKNWKGQKVLYSETLLYELLGNSYSANCVFVEIPRLLFNPHKTLWDTLGGNFS